MKLEIAPFHPLDTAEILALSIKAWMPVFEKMESAVPQYVFKAFYPEGWHVRQAADIENFLKAESKHVYVALASGTIIGWVGMRLHPEDKMGEIYILAVDPDHQRSGVARSLIEHALSEMRKAGLDIAMVETGDDPGHAPSRATYERAGFERWPVARYFREL